MHRFALRYMYRATENMQIDRAWKTCAPTQKPVVCSGLTWNPNNAKYTGCVKDTQDGQGYNVLTLFVPYAADIAVR